MRLRTSKLSARAVAADRSSSGCRAIAGRFCKASRAAIAGLVDYEGADVIGLQAGGINAARLANNLGDPPQARSSNSDASAATCRVLDRYCALGSHWQKTTSYGEQRPAVDHG